MDGRLWLGIETAVIGMGIVFLALYSLTLILQVFRKIFYQEEIEESLSEEPAATPAASSDLGSQEEITAAITAAVASFMDKTSQQISIVGIRAKSEQKSGWTGSGWKMAGRTEMMEKRQEHYE